MDKKHERVDEVLLTFTARAHPDSKVINRVPAEQNKIILQKVLLKNFPFTKSLHHNLTNKIIFLFSLDFQIIIIFFELKSFSDVNDENVLKIQKSLANSFLKMKMCVTAKTLIPPLIFSEHLEFFSMQKLLLRIMSSWRNNVKNNFC